MKPFALACSFAALASAPLVADPLTTDYTTPLTIGITPSTTNYTSGYSVDNFSLTGTDTLNFSSYQSVSFLLSADTEGYFTYDAGTTDSYLALSLTFGTSSAGMTATANYAITFLDASGNSVGVTYSSASLVLGSNDTYPDGICLFAEMYEIPANFTFSSIRIDMDYTGFSGTICSQDISLTNGSVQFWAASSEYTSLVTFTAVPEPTTCAAGLGLAGLGAAMVARRRRR